MKAKKAQRNHYVPLQIALLLLIREDNTDTEQCQVGLRKVLVLMLKQATMNNKIKEYVLSDSDMPILLVAKLAHFFGSLPEQLPLIRNPKVLESFPGARGEDQSHLCHLNLFQ